MVESERFLNSLLFLNSQTHQVGMVKKFAIMVMIMSPVKECRCQLLSDMGKVKLYILVANPEYLDIIKMHPAMTVEAPISRTIQPVLVTIFTPFTSFT